MTRSQGIPFLLCFVTLLQWASGAYGQALQPKRLEIEIERNEEAYEVEALGEQGLMLYRQLSDNSFGGDFPYEFIKVDTALEEQWRRVFRVERKYSLIGWDFHQDSLYFLFSHFNPTDDYFLLKMDLENGDTTQQMVRKVVPIQLTEFESVGRSLIFGGYVNNRATVLLYNRYNDQAQVLPNLYAEQSELMEISIDDATTTFDVSVLNREVRNPYSLTLRSYNDEGIQIREERLNLPDGLNIHYGRSANPSSGEKIVAGTYSDRRTDYTKGLFLANLQPTGQVQYNLYSYEDVPNFFNYMKAKRRERVKKRIERRRIKGRRSRLSYRLLVHEIIEQEDYIVVLGEAFYPVYRYYGGGGLGSSMGSRTSANSTYFDGFRYTHAVVMGLTPEGRMLWSNSFEIEGVQSMVLREYVKVNVNRDRIVLLYLYDGEIRAKVIRGDTMEEGKFFDPIDLKFGAEMVQSNDDEVGELDRWYEDYFYASGLQEVRKLNRFGFGRNRKVFYINKIIYP